MTLTDSFDGAKVPSITPAFVVKTVVHWTVIPEETMWLCVDGDQREFEGHFINNIEDTLLEQKMTSFFYDAEGGFKHRKITRAEAESMVRGGAFLVSCGYVL